MADVLVIASHPDDEVLGAGASMARWRAEGRDVRIAILGEGATSRSPSRASADTGAVEQLRADAAAAAEALGVEPPEMFGLPDNRFDTVAMLDVVKIIEDLVDRHRPNEVYTQAGGDLNIDHAVTFRATLTATRPVAHAAHRVDRVLAYEVGSSSEWAFGQFAPRFEANWFVDVSGYLDAKINAMRCYESESRSSPHPRSAEMIRAAAERCGSVIGADVAEAFALVRACS